MWSYDEYVESIKSHGVGTVNSGYFTYPDGHVTWIDPGWRENPTLLERGGLQRVREEIARRRSLMGETDG